MLLLGGQIADERLRGASMAAKAAAIEAVEQSVLSEEDEDDILDSGFVQLNIGNQSPMVRELHEVMVKGDETNRTAVGLNEPVGQACEVKLLCHVKLLFLCAGVLKVEVRPFLGSSRCTRGPLRVFSNPVCSSSVVHTTNI